MRRLVTLIVLLFAFAAVAGATTAHAHRYFSTPIVVLNHVNDDNRAIPVIVEVQRGEIDLGSGIMLPCGAHQAISVTVAQLALCRPETGRLPAIAVETPDWPSIRLLRPPRPA